MIRFGKPFGPLLQIKADFFAHNDELLKRQREIDNIYARQPLRRGCKVCDHSIGEADFQIGPVGYTWCVRCGHLNGRHEDSEAFSAAVYTEDSGAAYARAYAAGDREIYRRRVADIYLPKAKFLAEALEERGGAAAASSCVDLGAGSGYFVAALRLAGFRSVKGYDVSETQVRFANDMLGEALLTQHLPVELPVIAREIDADVVSMIGVLEHVSDARGLLSELRRNERVECLYISLPLVGPSVMFEAIFPEVMKRHLTGGHTHLFTERSIDWMCREFGLTRAAEWWFGSDLLDLYRSVMTELKRTPTSSPLAEAWERHFLPALDAMQLTLDERKLSSEAHFLLRFDR